MTQINAILTGVALICATALTIRLSTASVTKGRIWLLAIIGFMVLVVAKLTGLR